MNDFYKAGGQKLITTSGAALKGLKDEAGPLNLLIQQVNNNPGATARVTKCIAAPLRRSWCGHTVLLIMGQT